MATARSVAIAGGENRQWMGVCRDRQHGQLATYVRIPSLFAGKKMKCQRSMSRVHVRCMAKTPSLTEDLIKSKNEHNPVVVYSKTWCPYCNKVKGLFKKLGVKVVVVELDDLVDGAEVQATLKKMTGQASVPNVFIGGKHIGGCDDTHRLHSKGELLPLLQAAKAQIQS